jgi:hypothetical protein
LSWFFPNDFAKKQMGYARKWLPFADFFRGWLGSNANLWVMRLVSSAFIFSALFVLTMMILELVGF